MDGAAEISGEAQARVDHATSVSGEAQATAADPSGTAKSAATDAGVREARERAPVSPDEVRADVDVASEAVHNPAGAGEAQAEIAIDAEVRGVDPTSKK